MKRFIKKYLICNLIIYLLMICCSNYIFADQTNTAKIGENEYTWYNLPEGLVPQQVPSSEHVVETKSMKSTVYGLFGDVAKGSCSYGVGTKDGFEYCKDQLGTSYGITPAFDEAAEKNMIPRVVATAYAKNGKKFEIPRGTLIYIKSNVSGVEDYGYAIVADTGGAVEKGELDLYMPYAANNTKKNDAEKFNLGLDYRQLLKLDKSGSITVYITKYTLSKDKYIYMVPKGTIVDNSSSTTSTSQSESGVNKKIIYNTTKSVTTTGEKPSVLTTNCKDAVALYWSKTTTVTGDGAISSDPSGITVAGAPSQEMADMVAKAIAMAEKGGIKYRQTGRQEASTIEGLDAITQTDCSALVGSLYKTYLGFCPGEWANSEQMMLYGQNGQTCNGWTAKLYDYNGDTSVLLPGDILYRKGHVGLYVGDGKQVDHGGPGGKNSESNLAWRGPKYRDVGTQYTKFIRWTNPNATPTTDTTIGSGQASYVAKQKPSSKTEIDKVLDSMADIEIMARLIYGEQGGTSFESQVLVGLSILNRGSSIKETAKSKYSNGKYYQYNCIEDSLFWKAIPEEAVNAANKAIQVKQAGTYKVLDCRTNKSVEAINVYGFYAQSSTSFKSTWNNWNLQVVLKNPRNYTGFYVR